MFTRIGFTQCSAASALLAIFLSATMAGAAPTYIKTWGSYGTSGSNVFNNPFGVAASATGQLYVVNESNNRLEVFDTNGGYQSSFGSPGSGSGQFVYTVGVAVNAAGQVYVTDNDNNRVQRFSANGVFQTAFDGSGSGAGQFMNPYGVAVNAAGQVYVADTFNCRVQRFDTNGNYQTAFGSFGTGTGQFEFPVGVAVNATGQVYALDSDNNRVERFDANGNYQTAFGSYGTGLGQFNYPDGVAVSATGLVYVADSGNNRIERFDGNGNYQILFGSGGTGAGQLSYPEGIAVAPTGEIFVVDNGNNRVQKWFDLSEWVSGSPYFDSAAVGPGQLLGTNLNINSSQGLRVVGAFSINAGGSLTQAGSVSAASVTNNGQYTINGTSLTLTSGSLTNNTMLIVSSGGSVNGNTVNGYGATLNAGGAAFTGNLVNNSAFYQFGAVIVSGSFVNNGLVSMSPGGAISSGGTGSFTNNAAGIVRGDGAVTMAFANQGGLVNATGGSGLELTALSGGNVSGGRLQVENGDSLLVLNGGTAIANQGTIYLTGSNAELSGDPLANTGTIHGQGTITNSIQNSGTIRPEGGQLLLSGTGNSNTFGGTIQVAAGTSILVTQGMAINVGLIALTGGQFDNNGLSMTNYGSITGNGSFSSGGLANTHVVTFSDSTSNIFGPVTNTAGGTLSTFGTSATVISFFGAVVNSPSAGISPAGYIKINGNTVRWLGGLTNNGTYISDPAINYFTGLTVGASGRLQGGVGDRFFVTDPFTNAGNIDLGGTSLMVVNNGAGLLTQTAGVLHMGTSATLSVGTVEIDGGVLLADGPAAAITANLIYDSASPSTYQGMLVGASNSLTVNNPAAVLVLSGSNTYGSGTNVLAGTLVVTSPAAIRDGTNLTVGAAAAFAPAVPAGQGAASASAVSPVPEPGTLALLAAATLALMGRRRWIQARRASE